MSKLQLLLLGHFECLLPSGERIALSMRKAEVLLAYLALAPGIRHPRERLINLLWSDRGEEQARNSLRQCLSAIKKSLGEAADLLIVVDRTTVCLKPEMVDVDALEFERLATDGEFESLSDAAALYRGEFLEGISIRDAATQEWLETTRGRFKQQYVEILTNLGHTQLVSHDFSAAIRTAENLVVQDALGESGWRLLMRAYADNGDRSHALQAFKRCEQALRSELEVDPELATLTLREEIAGGQAQTPAKAQNNTSAATIGVSASPPVEAPDKTGESSTESTHSIAVLPFDNLSGDPEQEYFSDGITDSIILNLALFPGLQVKSRHSSFAFKQQIKTPGEISAELDVDYLVEGSIRKSSDRVRITVQLIEAGNGTQVWGNRYDAEIANLFELEEELSRTIAATVTGQIESDLRRIAISKSAEDQESYDLLLAGRYHANRFNRQDNIIAIDKFNRCIELDPENVYAHSALGACHGMDYLDRWTLDYQKSFEQFKWHTEKAMALNPDLEQVRANYAEYLVFAGDLDEAGKQIDKVLQINPNNPETLAIKTVILIVQEDFEAGLELAKRTLQLDPYHPWVEWELAGAQYWTGNYEATLETISAMRTDPGFTHLYAAASHAKLGHEETARKVLQDFMRDCEKSMLRVPGTREEWLDYCQSGYRFKDLKWHEDMVDCLVEVGLLDALDASSEATAADSHNIAVLPFDNLSGDPEQEYFSDGIAESVILHLTRFPGLIVKSRNSSFAFKQQIKSLGEISAELGVDYLVEGSLRKSGNQIRITVQLVEAASGNQIWGKRYDAELENLFDLEEELSRSIAATVTGRIESDLQRIALAKGASDLQAYDLLLGGMHHTFRFEPKHNVIAIEKLTQCLQLDPDNVRAHVYLSICQVMDYISRWTEDYQASFERAKTNIERALQLDPELGLVKTYYGEYLTFCGRHAEAHRYLDQALEINPNDTDALTIRANCLNMQGHFAESLELAQQVVAIDPYHPWVIWEVAGGQYHTGQYEACLETLVDFRTDIDFMQIILVACHVKLGDMESARQALQELLRISRQDMYALPTDLDDWFAYIRAAMVYDDIGYSEGLLDCLVKAGLKDYLGSSAAGISANPHSIAVLPFDNLSGDPAQEYFSDGISESIILHLDLFPDLVVKSRNSSFAFKQQIKSLGEISEELGVDYLVEGSVRKSADQIRITVQLIDAATGNQVWGKRYDAPLDDLFTLEEELSRSIAATVTGQIESDLQRIALVKGAADQKAYDLLLAGIYHANRSNRENIEIAIDKLNQCLALDPNNLRAHAALYQCHILNWMDRLVEDYQASFELAKHHTCKAMELDPDSADALNTYGEYLLFSHEPGKASPYLERARESNPNNPTYLTTIAMLQSMQGKFEAAIETAQRAWQLDPNNWWVDWNLAEAHFLCGNYQETIDTIARSKNAPQFIRIYGVAANVRLGNLESARESLDTYLDACRESMRAMPQTLDDWLQYTVDTAPFADAQINRDIIDCLVQAGLEDHIGTPVSETPTSSHSIAVLPFDNLSGDPDQVYFSDGITDSIILNLSLFPELSVKSRNASFAFKEQLKSVGEISRELGVDYVVEGSIRKSDRQVRITVQLIKGESGNQVWGKRYDAGLENLFDLEEELSRSIAATVTGQIDSEMQRIAIGKGATNLQAYDLLLAGSHHLAEQNAVDNQLAIEKLNQCLQLDPGNARAHVQLYYSHMLNLMDRWIEDFEQSRNLAEAHVLKAVSLSPRQDFVQIAHSEYLTFRHRYEESEQQLKKLVELNPSNAEAIAQLAVNLSSQGKPHAALEQAELAIRLDPYQTWYYWIKSESLVFCERYDDCLATIRGIVNPPGFIRIYAVVSLLRLGRDDEAREELGVFLAFCREHMAAMPRTIADWRQYYRDNAPMADPVTNDAIIDCLVDAGLTDTQTPGLKANATDTHTIAVLPFDNLSGDPEQEYFSDGITESIIFHLERFPDLSVKSRHSSFAFKQQIKSLGEISAELAVAYLVEGSIRKSSEQIRVTVQLVETASGNQVWGKRYDAPLDDLFNLEEELSRSIAATVTGQIESDLQRVALGKRASDQQTYDLLLSAIYHGQRYTREDTVIAIEKLQQCLQKEPQNAMVHAWLYDVYLMDYLERWSPDHKAVFQLGAEHILKAMELAPDETLVQLFHAQYKVFCGELDEATGLLKKLLSRNPDNPTVQTTMALNLELQGKAEEALQHAERACELDPYHPWAEWEVAVSLYVSGEYERVLETFENLRTTPGFIQIFAIAANIKLGRDAAAKKGLQHFLEASRETMQAFPSSIDEWMEYTRENYPFADPQYNRDIVDCLVQAGLEPGPVETGESAEQPSILVLPFGNLSGDPEQDYFSDGITESIIVTLSASSGLTVKSRHTSFAYRDSMLTPDQIGEKLEVQYIVEGSIRKYEEQVRITIQLSETATGNQVWGKRYDTPLNELFSLEEELVQTIAGTISGRIGRDIKINAKQRPSSNPKSYDYLMRGWYHGERFTPENNKTAHHYFSKCVELDPDNATGHGVLGSNLNVQRYENWSVDRDATGALAERHINRALELEPGNALAHAFMSEHLLFERKYEQALSHAEHAIEHDPGLPDGYGAKGFALCLMGRNEEAIPFAEQSLKMDPYHFYMGWNAGSVFRTAGEYQKAIDTYRAIPVMPPSLHAEIAACLIGLGETEAAKTAMHEYLRLAREQLAHYPSSEAEWRELWSRSYNYQFESDFEPLWQQLQQAGLCEGLELPLDAFPSVAVLPFKNLSSDTEQEYFSDGITTSIILALSQFDGMVVKSQKTSFAFKSSELSSAEIADRIGVDYLVEGTIRKSAQRIRLSVQLVEAENGSQVWGQQYDRDLEDLLELEQELSQALAATISGRLGHNLQQSAAHKPARDLKSYDHLMRGLYHFGKFTAEDMRIAREEIEKCIALDPENVQAHANLGEAWVLDLLESWAEDPALAEKKAREHFEIALELEPDHALTHAYLADFLNLMKDYDNAQFHAERAIEINPNSSEGHAALADLLSGLRHHDEAIREADICLRLDPYSVGSIWVAGGVYHNAGQYQEAIKILRKIPHPPPSISIYITSCFIGMGLVEEARAEMKRYLQLAKQQMPRLPDSVEGWRAHLQHVSAYFRNPEDFEALFEQLLEAGLGDYSASDEIPSIAVLPFENLSDSSEQAFFADGITSDIISTLSKFRHLRIIARHSTEIYRDEKASIAEIAQQQNVRYILEGSVRSSGKRIRVSADLIDSQTEENCWSERYDRDLDDLFAVQDDITQKITLAMKVHLDDGEMALQRSAGTTNLKAWELTLTAVDLADTYIRQNILDARAMVKQAIELDPDYPYAWVMLAWTYWQEIYVGCEGWEENLAEAENAVQCALDMNPDDAAALNQSAFNYLMRHDADKALEFCRKSVELEPGNAEFQGLMAYVYAFTGDYERARVHEQKMRALCPYRPNWYYLLSGQIEEGDGHLDKAIETYRQALEVEPDSPLCRYYLVNLLQKTGDVESAHGMAEEIKSLDPNADASGLARSTWLDPDRRSEFEQNLARFGLI